MFIKNFAAIFIVFGCFLVFCFVFVLEVGPQMWRVVLITVLD